jgi:hypothetical protein
MLIWGPGNETKDLGFVERKRCETCGKERPFKLFLRYQYAHIGHLFKWGERRKYYLVCHVCRRGRRIDPEQMRASLSAISKSSKSSVGTERRRR